jgi:hypothetical protein
VTEWLAPSDVAAYLGDTVDPEDPNLATVTDGIRSYLEGIRSDVFGPPAAPIAAPVVPSSLKLGAVLWCAHAYQIRSGPSGFSGYGDGAGDAMYDLSLASNRADIWRLTGVKRPVSA